MFFLFCLSSLSTTGERRMSSVKNVLFYVVSSLWLYKEGETNLTFAGVENFLDQKNGAICFCFQPS